MKWPTCYVVVVAVVAVLATAVLASAQPAALMQGTVLLKGGQTISGNIKAAELGSMDGNGVGTNLTDNGAIAVKLDDGSVTRVPAADIAIFEAAWEESTEPGGNPWIIKQLKVTKRDGTVITGVPDWFMHASSVAIETAAGEVKRFHAFPLAKDFTPDNLLVRVQLAQPAATPPAPITPAPTTPAPTTTPPTTPTPTVPTPTAPTTPTPTTPAPTTTPQPVPVPIEPVPATTTPSPVTEPPTTTTVEDVHVLPSQDIVVTLRCPACGEPITLLISISALKGIATGASGVNVSPVVPVN